MLLKFLRSLHGALNGFVSLVRLIVPRIFGLHTGQCMRVGVEIEWPLGNVRNIQIGDGVSLGKRGWFYLPLNNRQAKIQIGSGTSIGNDFVITASNSIQIGRECLLSYRVTLMDHAHVTARVCVRIPVGLPKASQ